jgi:hypothetical protein
MLLILAWLLTEIADTTKTDIKNEQDDLGRGLFDVGQVVGISFFFKHKC